MKTETTLRQINQAAALRDAPGQKSEKQLMTSIYKSDLKNHRFAIIDNRRINDPSSWDHSWFTNYE